MRNGGLSLLALATLAGTAACESGNQQQGMAERSRSRYVVSETGGGYTLYSGPNVADVLITGRKLGDRDTQPYYALRVPAGLVERARANPTRLLSFSLEQSASEDVQLVVNYFPEPNKPATIRVKPGDPGVTGMGQVWIGPDGQPVGLFELAIWKKYPNGPMVKNVYTTGLRSDPQEPALQFNGDPSKWTTLPDSWKALGLYVPRPRPAGGVSPL
jgi:hypothetical protein